MGVRCAANTYNVSEVTFAELASLRDLDIETPSTRCRVFSKTEMFSANSSTIYT